MRTAVLGTSALLAALACTGACNRNPVAAAPASNDAATYDANNALAVDTTPLSNDEALNEAAADATANATTVPVSKPGEPLLKYEGQLAAEGFLDDPLLKKAVRAAVPDAKVRHFIFTDYGRGPESPIKEVNGRLLAWGCEVHNCGFHEWSIAISPNGGNAEVCYYESENSDTGRAKFYSAGRKVKEKFGDCPNPDK
jgi:hypothetical protein